MPVISFPIEDSFPGIQIRLSHTSLDIWEISAIRAREPRVQLIHVEDKDLESGVSRRVTTRTMQELQAILADEPLVVFKPSRPSQQTLFRIFGHKSDLAFPLNDEEIAHMDSLGVSLIEDHTNGISWFGCVLTDADARKGVTCLARMKKLLEVEFNLTGLELRLHTIDFSSKQR